MACFICPYHGRVCDGQCPEANPEPCPGCPREPQKEDCNDREDQNL